MQDTVCKYTLIQRRENIYYITLAIRRVANIDLQPQGRIQVQV